MTDLAPVIFYPVELPKIVILRNATYRKRFIVKVDGVELDLTQNDLVIDADIKDATGVLIGTFTAVLPEDESNDPIPGMFDLELGPAETLALPVATTHQTDISITNPGGDRFYYAKAAVEVHETQSRNT